MMHHPCAGFTEIYGNFNNSRIGSLLKEAFVSHYHIANSINHLKELMF